MGPPLQVEDEGRPLLLIEKDVDDKAISVADSPVSRRELTIDEMLQQGVGECGWAQQRHFFLVSLPWITEAIQTLLMVFIDREPPWRCTFLAADSAKNQPILCSQSSSICSLTPEQWEWVDSQVSTVSEFDLTCESAWKASLVQSFFFFGFLFGAGAFGALSDGFLGRKRALFVCSATVAVAGALTALSPSYWLYVAFRFLTGFGCGGLGLVAFVLACEPIGPKYRQYLFAVGIMGLSVAAYLVPRWRALTLLMSLPSALYLLLWGAIDESPRWLLVRGRVAEAMAVLQSMAAANGTRIPPGAVLGNPHPAAARARPAKRHLVLSPGKPDVAGQAAALDKPACSSPREEQGTAGVGLEGRGGKVERVGTICQQAKAAERSGRGGGGGLGALALLQRPLTRKWLLTVMCCWGVSKAYVRACCSLGAAHHMVVRGLVEVPAYAIAGVLLSRLGRRLTLSGGFLLSGVCCLLSGLFSAPAGCLGGAAADAGAAAVAGATEGGGGGGGEGGGSACGPRALQLALVFCGKFGIAAAFNIIYVFTAELFPTEVRNAALGMASQAARVAGIIAPSVVLLGRLHRTFPSLLFGSLGLLAGSLILLLPETLNKPLMETMDELEGSCEVDAAPAVALHEA
eukprot:jgi/Mesen1/3707/ME000202S02790